MAITQFLAVLRSCPRRFMGALCLLLVIEGMMPFLYPEKWQAWLSKSLKRSPRCSGGWLRHDDLWFIIVDVA